MDFQDGKAESDIELYSESSKRKVEANECKDECDDKDNYEDEEECEDLCDVKDEYDEEDDYDSALDDAKRKATSDDDELSEHDSDGKYTESDRRGAEAWLNYALSAPGAKSRATYADSTLRYDDDLTSVGINPQFITFTNVTMESEKYICILARFCPLPLGGIEEDLVHLLEDDNEIIKEGALHILARTGGTIREKLGVSSRPYYGAHKHRRQAKHAVHALASITKDDGLKSHSVLYKRLVAMLEEKSHSPSVLQSLGCIAQAAMPVSETRESEIQKFIKLNILEIEHVFR
ncbi:clathrin heavy chain 2 [Phtheirospermum japonicum]|uniref:Clathrin heavy chain 2 n=1 Tax=Phtheirospermum japonicum TaxID=374723 RepID=A0A830BLA8_9LAMI|nr:clathrin heavy chain 2 [Phtheirospermum japonicum]